MAHSSTAPLLLQVAPFAGPCAEKLCQAFIAYADNDGDDDASADAGAAAASCLGTLSTLIITVKGLPEFFPALEAGLLPMLQVTDSQGAAAVERILVSLQLQCRSCCSTTTGRTVWSSWRRH